MHQCPSVLANIPAQILVGKTLAKMGGQRTRMLEARTQYILSGGGLEKRREKKWKKNKKRKKSWYWLLDIVSDKRTSTAIQGVQALGQIHTSLSPERDTVMRRTGKVVRIRLQKRLFFNFRGNRRREITLWVITLILAHTTRRHWRWRR